MRIQGYLLNKNQAHSAAKAHASTVYEIVTPHSICGEQVFGRRNHFFPRMNPSINSILVLSFDHSLPVPFILSLLNIISFKLCLHFFLYSEH